MASTLYTCEINFTIYPMYYQQMSDLQKVDEEINAMRVKCFSKWGNTREENTKLSRTTTPTKPYRNYHPSKAK